MAYNPTWRNIGIDSGASAAAFGRVASDNARGLAQTGDLLFQQGMQGLEREDELLTNEAIASALMGGPRVSPNRRVDQNALQLSVERDLSSKREQTRLGDDLLSSSVARRLNSNNADLVGKRVANFDERFELDKAIAEADAAYKQSQSSYNQARRDELIKAREKLDRIEGNVKKFNDWFYGPEIQADADRAIDERVKGTPEWESATPQQRRLMREQARKDYRASLLNDPEKVRAISVKFDMTPLEFEKYSAAGRDFRESQVAVQTELAARAADRAEAQQVTFGNMDKFIGNNLDYLSHDGTDFVYEKSTKADGPTRNTALRNVGLNPDKPKVRAFDEAVKAKFVNASAYEAFVNKNVIDGEIPENYQQIIDTTISQLKQQAIDRRSVKASNTYGDFEGNLDNWLDSLASGLKNEATEEEQQQAGKAALADPAMYGDAVEAINTNPTSQEETDEAWNSLQLAIKGLDTAGKDIEIPDYASRELEAMYRQYRDAVRVAQGGAITEGGNSGFGVGVIRTPTFVDKKEAASAAATVLQQLMARMKLEAEEEERRSFRDQLDQRR